MHIYTRLGDKGSTVTLGGRKVQKDDPLIEAQGQIDELNAALGIAVAFIDDADATQALRMVQKELFVLGAELSMDNGSKRISPKHVEDLEKQIDSYEERLPALANFVLPGGCKSAALVHYARTVCRRCERKLVTLSNKKRLDPIAITYLNRLGDLLFTMARWLNRKKRVDEIVWKG